VSRAVHPIELQSYEILRSRTDTSGLPPLTRAVLERIVHASADLGYVTDLVCAEDALQAGARALHAGAPVVTDSQMVAAGITARPVTCRVRDSRAAELAAAAGITRSAAGIRVAFEETGPGAVWVIGTAPTALHELITLGVAPSLVIGLPVGFVGAVEAKEALRSSELPAVSNRSERGGAAVAAAAVNALLYAEVTAP
jgi:precorrin-8X/cobalt-precorrin-8 methylmutase